LTFPKLTKTSLVYSVSILGGLELCLDGLSPPKPHPVATGLSRLWTKVEQAADHTTFSYNLLRMSAVQLMLSEGIKITLQ